MTGRFFCPERLEDFFVVVRGGGDIATGTIHKLVRCGFSVLVLESARPSAIRRKAAFCEAVYEGSQTLEGVTAVRVSTWQQAKEEMIRGRVPVLVDTQAELLEEIRPAVLVDGILAKKNCGTKIDMADTVIALGPGFTAGVDVHYVIETQRGHDLGRIYEQGSALPNTGIPGVIAGYAKERVIHSPANGILTSCVSIGDVVTRGQVLARIDGINVCASIDGVLRGMIRDGYPVTEGFKIADIDPRVSERKNCHTISDKARCIAGSVVEAIFMGEEQRRKKA